MTLPTAHNYVIKNLIENLGSIEANFKAKYLDSITKKTELGLMNLLMYWKQRIFSQDMLKNEKENIGLIIEKLSLLEKAQEKS